MKMNFTLYFTGGIHVHQIRSSALCTLNAFLSRCANTEPAVQRSGSAATERRLYSGPLTQPTDDAIHPLLSLHPLQPGEMSPLHPLLLSFRRPRIRLSSLPRTCGGIL